MVQLSIVIVTHNSSSVIVNAIDSIYEFIRTIEFEIIIVDNNSSDTTVSILKGLFRREITIIENPQNKGFAFANNQAFQQVNGKYILIYNPDLILTAQTNISQLIKILESRSDIGIVAPRLYYSNGTIQESVRGFPNPLAQMIRVLKLDRYFTSNTWYANYMIRVDKIENDTFVDWAIGAFILIKKKTLFDVNLFDSSYFMYMEDTDLCLRLKRKGYKTLYTPGFSAIHLYKRESSKKIFSKLKWIHFISSLRFHFKYYFT